MRYFHYLSQEKVEEAYGQVPHALVERLSGELRLPVVPVKVSVGEAPDRDSQYAKLDLAEAALNADGQIGSIAAPCGWFRGTMTMKWGCFGLDDEQDPEVAFFIGDYADITVAIGGSAYNAKRTGQSEERRDYSNSGHATLMHALRAESLRVREAGAGLSPPAPERGPGVGDSETPVAKRLWRPTLPDAPGAWPAEAVEVKESLPGPGEHVEFVARWLDQSDYQTDYKVLLGTPLYVSSAVGLKESLENKGQGGRRFPKLGRRLPRLRRRK